MQYFYNIVKIIYYVLTIFVGVFFLRGEFLFGTYYTSLLEYIIPGYLVLCGMMFGYIISKLAIINTDDINNHAAIQMRSFVIGTILGVILALVYIFLR
ncbi:hypothetical protein XF24_00569 [candidate division SR1 bacterium Aalborg_AAW-1]|nr:hypothetical protein XF24_00569 [candidate division SR1 bacterium Aalborg_AAW-1]